MEVDSLCHNGKKNIEVKLTAVTRVVQDFHERRIEMRSWPCVVGEKG